VIYVVTMYRWGDREKHSYVAWAGRSMKKAIYRAVDEENERGGKYEAEVVAFSRLGNRKVIREMPNKR